MWLIGTFLGVLGSFTETGAFVATIRQAVGSSFPLSYLIQVQALNAIAAFSIPLFMPVHNLLPNIFLGTLCDCLILHGHGSSEMGTLQNRVWYTEKMEGE